MSKSFPKAVVFDLDYTLWPCWCDTHLEEPLKKVLGDSIVDAVGFELRIYEGVRSSLKLLKEKKIPIIAASRTARPDLAKKLLSLFEVDGECMMSYFDVLQWGQGSKVNHIKRAISQLQLNKELDHGDVILFDDELRNRDVEQINCYFAHVKDSEEGLTTALFEKAIDEWSRVRNKV